LKYCLFPGKIGAVSASASAQKKKQSATKAPSNPIHDRVFAKLVSLKGSTKKYIYPNRMSSKADYVTIKKTKWLRFDPYKLNRQTVLTFFYQRFHKSEISEKKKQMWSELVGFAPWSNIRLNDSFLAL
jgi:hypothetical protein